MINKPLIKAQSASFKVSKDTYWAIIIFIIFPLYSVPLIIKGMWKQKKWAFVLWAIFMGLIGILVPPTGDFYRYTMDYEMYKGLDWNDFWLLASLKNELMLPLISYFISKLSLNFDISRFIYNFLGYFLLGLTYLDIVHNNVYLQYLKSKKNAIYALGFFIFFSFSVFCFRYYLSAMFFLYGAYLVVYKKKKCGWWLVGLAIFNHLSYVVQAVALLLQQCHFFKFGKKTVVFLVLISFCLDSSFIIEIFNLLPLEFVSQYMVYLDGYWAGDFLENHSWKYKLLMFITNLVQYFCILVYILQYRKADRNYVSLTNAMLLLTTISTPFVTINGRFLVVMMYFVKVHLLVIYDNTKKMRKYLMILFWLTMLSNMLGIVGFRRQIQVSDLSILFYSTSFHVLNHTYDTDWIDRNVSEDGDILTVK